MAERQFAGAPWNTMQTSRPATGHGAAHQVIRSPVLTARNASPERTSSQGPDNRLSESGKRELNSGSSGDEKHA